MSAPRLDGVTVRVPELPHLHWTHVEGVAELDASAGALTLRAAAGVDWSNDPVGATPVHGATMLGFAPPASDFSLSAHVAVPGPRTTFDAGALALWADDDHWAKLCFEYSPQGQAMVVSVVTNGHSDDTNSWDVEGDGVWLRISRVGPAWAFHASADGRTWDFVRLFRLRERPTHVGFLSQAPLGDTCEARFTRIALAEAAPADLRDGS